MLKFDTAHAKGFGCWSCFMYGLQTSYDSCSFTGAAGKSFAFDGTVTCHLISITVH